jgi:hypothetical protein
VSDTGTMPQRRFRLWLTVLAFGYLFLQSLYIAHNPLVMDEFDGAAEAHQLRRAVPYRDYVPYKTVLGYYIQLPAVAIGPNVWDSLMIAKGEMAAINAVMLLIVGLALARHFRGDAILIALLMGVFLSTFLERSADLRVDMMTGWAGLASLLLLLERRYAAAGAMCALSFLISQKGALYFVAANAAILIWFVLQRSGRDLLRNGARFNVAWAAIIGAYIAFWSMFASWRKVITVTFFGHVAETAVATLYDIRARYWPQTLVRNPFFWALCIVALIALELRRRRAGAEYTRAIIYAAVILVLAAWYRQPWPYFFVIVVPPLWVLHAAFFDDVLASPRFRRTMLALVALFGIAYPALRIGTNLRRDNSFQEANVRIAEAALGPHDTYLAGNDVIFTRDQTLPELSRLGAVVIDSIRSQSAQQHAAMIAMLDAKPPKLIIVNYRIIRLPAALRVFFERNFGHYWANVFSYAPVVNPGQKNVQIAFDGDYAIDAPAGAIITIDGQPRRLREVIRLARGVHAIDGSSPVRLRLQLPVSSSLLDPATREIQDFYPKVYDY